MTNAGEKLREIAARLNDIAETFDPPKPPTLREKVAGLLDSVTRFPTAWDHADAVLAVIADEMAKRPLIADDYIDFRAAYRNATVAWLRGES